MARSIILALLVSVAAAPVQAQSQAQVQPRAGVAPQAGDKMVCRSREVTGSLVKKRKVCQLQATWDKQSESYKEQWAPLQGTLGNSRGN